MKTKLPVILSLISILGVISVWGLWLCESLELTVVSLDTFVGVIVALLAIVVTVAIGYQIINAIDLREKISQLEYQGQLSRNEKEDLVKLAHNLQSGINGAEAQLYCDKCQYVEAFVFYHTALKHAIFSDEENQMTRIHHLSNITRLILAKPVVDYAKLKQIIESDREAIRTTTSYRNCFGQEYEKVLQKFWDKMEQLGLESEEKCNDDGQSNNL